MQDKSNIFDFDRTALRELFISLEHPKYRADQVIKWLHQGGETSFAAMSNISKKLQLELTNKFAVQTLHCSKESISKDGTIKWLFAVTGNNLIETVFIPERTRGTLCVSSQAGCALKCSFCATGKQGFSRNLSTAEIILQLWQAQKRLDELGNEQKITNVVMMGMGEPLLNLKNLTPALNLMLDDFAYGLSKYKVTVSTSGIVPAMETLKETSEVSMAVSLHAANDKDRDILVPINKKYNIKQLMECCQNYFEKHPRRMITFEYILIDQVNDTKKHALDLAKLVKTINCKVNLIPYNPIDGVDYKTSTKQNIDAFRTILERSNINTTVRKTKGDDIAAACGQLAGNIKAREKKQTHEI
jgi:23S rRNA (adenine2503-C2)-methyltransferase